MKKFIQPDPCFYKLKPANYHDYRDFLKDRFEEIKKKMPKYSLMVCAKKSGISKSQLQFIFQKKRHLSLDRIPPLAKALKLKSDEEYYTYLLVCKNSSGNEKIRSHFENILNRIRSQHVRTVNSVSEDLDGNYKKLYSNQNLVLLQSLVKLNGFQEDPRWIMDNLKVPSLSENEILEGFRYLEKVGALKRDADGRLNFDSFKTWRPDPYDDDGFSVYTKSAEATAFLMQTPKVYRPSVYSSMALALDEKNLLEAEKYMIGVHHHLCKLANESTNPTSIAHIGNFLLTVLRT